MEGTEVTIIEPNRGTDPNRGQSPSSRRAAPAPAAAISPVAPISPVAHSKAIWLLSDGRSGSTWFAQLLNCHHRFHVEHEPIHHNFNPRLLDQPLMPFPEDAALETHYLPLFEDMLAGRYITHRFGQKRTGGNFGNSAGNSNSLIIRDIHGLLIAPRLLSALPQLQPAIIVRHPAEVAASKIALTEWDWFADTERYLEDKTVRRELTGLGHLIAAANTPYRRHVIHWAASHRFFFSAVSPRSLPIIRYPGARADMSEGVERVLATIGQRETTHDTMFDIAWRTRSATERPPCDIGLFRKTFRRPRPSRRDLAFTEKVIDAFCLRWLVPWTAFAEAPASQSVPQPATSGATLWQPSARPERPAFGF